MGLAARGGYADLVSPRVARDVSAIEVEIRSSGIGRGLPEEGGGPLRGGLVLAGRFDAVIVDPDVPFEIIMRVGAHDGWLVCEAITVSETTQDTPLNAAALRSLALSLYMQRTREELGKYPVGGLLLKEKGRTENTVSYELPVVPGDWETFDLAQVRRAVHASKITTQMAADALPRRIGESRPGAEPAAYGCCGREARREPGAHLAAAIAGATGGHFRARAPAGAAQQEAGRR